MLPLKIAAEALKDAAFISESTKSNEYEVRQ
jgi:hypothetical protein